MCVQFSKNDEMILAGSNDNATRIWAVETGRVPPDRPRTSAGDVPVRLQCPCGLVTAYVAPSGAARFESVPSFAVALDVVVALEDGTR